ncbi:hypothetical protein MKW94_022996 [Papaver nudicaule]|uniref:Protein kinase domain-containing protein n=1 Tax=Papaver nudicaule TaxID=74823 RepID=A0AA41RQC9_PAPNU|nr:hypothetical protein [Papaver nudicaule]
MPELQTWLLRNRVGLFQESEIRGWCRQIFRALTQMNQPDFGQAREVESQTPCSDYVTTRWYSAAEVLLNSSPYNSALYSFTPLFPGSNQADQLKKICSVVGSPTRESWAEGIQLENSCDYEFPLVPLAYASGLSIPSASGHAVNLIESLISWDPNNRPTALEHPYFDPSMCVSTSLEETTTSAMLEQRRYVETSIEAKPLPNFSIVGDITSEDLFVYE